jgi:ribosomal protein S18 acetylase RimI-like enzyme
MHDKEVYRRVAQIHANNIDQGFLSTLGTPFLTLLYEAIDANESSVLLVARHKGQVVGFVSGAEGMGAIYRHLLRRFFKLAWALLPAMASPRKLWKIGEILLMSKKTQVRPDFPHAELLSIAIDPAQRGQGHAQNLYQELVEHFKGRRVSLFRIVVGEALPEAQRFYTKMGAQPLGQIEVHQGRVSLVYVHQISMDASPNADLRSAPGSKLKE